MVSFQPKLHREISNAIPKEFAGMVADKRWNWRRQQDAADLYQHLINVLKERNAG